MLKSSDAIYLLISLTNVIVKASSVGQDQKQSNLCLHCLIQRRLKDVSRLYKIRRIYCDKRLQDYIN